MIGRSKGINMTVREIACQEVLKNYLIDLEGISIGQAAKCIGIDVKEYNPDIHWPIFAARQIHEFTIRFMEEWDRLEKNQLSNKA
jgi:hypothetical protein